MAHMTHNHTLTVVTLTLPYMTPTHTYDTPRTHDSHIYDTHS